MVKNITMEEVLKLDGINIIDVREVEEFKGGSIPGAKNIPMTGLIMNPNTFLDKEQTYYILCQVGGRSMQTCISLEDKGYKVINIEGGYLSYK